MRCFFSFFFLRLVADLSSFNLASSRPGITDLTLPTNFVARIAALRYQWNTGML